MLASDEVDDLVQSVGILNDFRLFEDEERLFWTYAQAVEVIDTTSLKPRNELTSKLLLLDEHQFREEVHMTKHQFFSIYYLFSKSGLLRDGSRYGIKDKLLMAIYITANSFSYDDCLIAFGLSNKGELSRMFTQVLDAFCAIQHFIINKDIVNINVNRAENPLYQNKSQEFKEAYKIFVDVFGYDGSIGATSFSISGYGLTEDLKNGDYYSYEMGGLGISTMAIINTRGLVDYLGEQYPAAKPGYETYKMDIWSSNLDRVLAYNHESKNFDDSKILMKFGDNEYYCDQFLVVPYEGNNIRCDLLDFGFKKVSDYDYSEPDSQSVMSLQPRDRYELFNLNHSQVRVSIDQLFGAVKNRFRILNNIIEFPTKKIPQLTKFCFILHNLLTFNDLQLFTAVRNIIKNIKVTDFESGRDLDSAEDPTSSTQTRANEYFSNLVTEETKCESRVQRLRVSLMLERNYIKSFPLRLKMFNFKSYDIVYDGPVVPNFSNDEGISIQGRNHQLLFEQVLISVDNGVYKLQREKLEVLKRDIAQFTDEELTQQVQTIFNGTQ
ncbi:hypothetical protein WICANDRAFT_90232 [Wickerhamomyces anomalus NRRL Y-366-8]|uniref:Uncharacterized protein n=1 Tax=Wickerhamomyces anomalus (strain ATCC 58044 / CBS 1984 / NCYC 433 / NRRL Y-366-8) TaxID=683960 RepID=A0A1E3P7Q4_WICAA|nr:uncharacterized protein WICANDRAFT_90232 [Wickerhamomyces anomalus NRRL Y-366-8]ODQ60942.1 hypothetical protein WICANDRAFT_90232 [Wickerhamomyces anomalus NRRL Y-366-8]